MEDFVLVKHLKKQGKIELTNKENKIVVVVSHNGKSSTYMTGCLVETDIIATVLLLYITNCTSSSLQEHNEEF